MSGAHLRTIPVSRRPACYPVRTQLCLLVPFATPALGVVCHRGPRSLNDAAYNSLKYVPFCPHTPTCAKCEHAKFTWRKVGCGAVTHRHIDKPVHANTQVYRTMLPHPTMSAVCTRFLPAEVALVTVELQNLNIQETSYVSFDRCMPHLPGLTRCL